jgi:hypothetical protein
MDRLVLAYSVDAIISAPRSLADLWCTLDNRVILIHVKSASDRGARADYGIYTVGKVYAIFVVYAYG